MEIYTIPFWLQNSNLSYVLLTTFNTPYFIPENKFEEDIKLNCEKDLYKFIEICMYWCMDEFPFEIYDYVKNNINRVDFNNLKKTFPSLILIDELILLTSPIRYKLAQFAAEKGYINMLKYSKYIQSPWNERTIFKAAKNGKFKCLKYLLENNCPYDKEKIMDEAAKNGNLECVKYLYESGIPFTNSLFYITIQYGNLDVLKYIMKQGCETHVKACYFAASNDQFNCLKFLHQEGFIIDEEVCYESANKGFLNCLRYSINYCPKDKLIDICSYAIDNIDCLKFLHEEIGFPLDQNTCRFALHRKNYITFKYGYENGCSVEDISLENLSL
jgi:ribosomal protein S8